MLVSLDWSPKVKKNLSNSKSEINSHLFTYGTRRVAQLFQWAQAEAYSLTACRRVFSIIR